jgi:hypothetical protein
MKKVIMTIILFGICMALVVGVIIPVTQLIRDTGQKSFNSVKTLSDNIVEGTN